MGNVTKMYSPTLNPSNLKQIITRGAVRIVYWSLSINAIILSAWPLTSGKGQSDEATLSFMIWNLGSDDVDLHWSWWQSLLSHPACYVHSAVVAVKDDWLQAWLLEQNYCICLWNHHGDQSSFYTVPLMFFLLLFTFHLVRWRLLKSTGMECFRFIIWLWMMCCSRLMQERGCWSRCTCLHVATVLLLFFYSLVEQ